MHGRDGGRRLVMNRLALGGLAAWLLLACGSDPAGIRFSALTEEDARDGWVDTAQTLAGDGATSFDSYLRTELWNEGSLQGWRPYFLEGSVDAGPMTRVVGDHLLSLSRARGLISTRVTGPDAARVEGRVPLSGLPVGFFTSDGVAAVLVIDPIQPRCSNDDCVQGQSSRVVLVDVRDPASPRALAEHPFQGTVFAARQSDGVLHVLSREVVVCSNCALGSSTELTWLSFNRSAAAELPPPRVVPVSGNAFFGEESLFVLSRGAIYGSEPPELRMAELTGPEPMLSAPVALGGHVSQAIVSGDRLRVTYGGAFDLETFAFGEGTVTSLGRGSLPLPDGDSLARLSIDGDRAVAMLEPSGRLAVLDLSVANAPSIASLLALELSESNLAFAGDRVLAVGGSRLDADAPPDSDTIARGPQALVLVDIADPAAPRIMDRATLGSFDAVQGTVLELRGDNALLSYYDAFPGASVDGADCGRASHRLMGYDIASGRLAPAFAFDGFDADGRIEVMGDEWWVASSVSVSRYVMGSAAPTARSELTRLVQGVRALAGGVALFGVDFASNAPTLELATLSSPLESTPPLDVARAAELSRAGCYERRRWAYWAMERAGNVYALRYHLPVNGADSAAAATLHVVDAATGQGTPSPPRSLELEPLAADEDYLGAVELDGALLLARGRRYAAPAEPGRSPRSLFSASFSSDPTVASQQALAGAWYGSLWEGLHPESRLSYDVIDLADPAAPVVASRLDIDPALATGGFSPYRSAWEPRLDGLEVGLAMSGSILVGQHAEPAGDGGHRFYLDRFDLSDPRAPIQLAPVEIPGSVLDFDVATGGLITNDTLFVEEPAGADGCPGLATSPGDRERPCGVLRRALSGLVVDDGRATRVGRLLLESNERRAVRFAASRGTVYYATQPMSLASEHGGPFAAREVTIERVVLRDGRFERRASLDITGWVNLSPEHWEQFAASGERVLWVAGSQLLVADFAGGQPRIEVHELGPWGCGALDVRADVAYCAQGPAGFLTVTLGAP